MGDNMYQNGKIYKIVDNGYNLCYYGSTCQPLSKRLSTHKKIIRDIKTVGKIDRSHYARYLMNMVLITVELNSLNCLHATVRKSCISEKVNSYAKMNV